MTEPQCVTLTVNGEVFRRSVAPRRLLVDFLRDDLGLKATHLGCGEGVCGACTVIIDGEPARSCTLLALQAEGASILTVEGLNASEGLTRVQSVLKYHHALQCGFCTPGIIATATAMVEQKIPPDENLVRAYLAGHLCRCTGYRNLVTAIMELLSNADTEAER